MENISSKENKRIKTIKKLLSSASFRREEGVFVAEGLRLCGDAIKSGAEIVSAFFSESFYAKNASFVHDVSLYKEEPCRKQSPKRQKGAGRIHLFFLNFH